MRGKRNQQEQQMMNGYGEFFNVWFLFYTSGFWKSIAYEWCFVSTSKCFQFRATQTLRTQTKWRVRLLIVKSLLEVLGAAEVFLKDIRWWWFYSYLILWTQIKSTSIFYTFLWQVFLFPLNFFCHFPEWKQIKLKILCVSLNLIVMINY